MLQLQLWGSAYVDVTLGTVPNKIDLFKDESGVMRGGTYSWSKATKLGEVVGWSGT